MFLFPYHHVFQTIFFPAFPLIFQLKLAVWAIEIIFYVRGLYDYYQGNRNPWDIQAADYQRQLYLKKLDDEEGLEPEESFEPRPIALEYINRERKANRERGYLYFFTPIVCNFGYWLVLHGHPLIY